MLDKPPSSFIDLESIITAKLDAAKKTAMPTSEMYRMHEDMTNLTRVYHKGNIDKNKLLELQKAIGIAWQPGLITCENAAEFKLLIHTMCATKEEAEEILEHENSHALAFIKNGCKVIYKVHVSKNPDDTFAFLPFISGLGDLSYEALNEVTLAPGSPSQLDENMLGK